MGIFLTDGTDSRTRHVRRLASSIRQGVNPMGKQTGSRFVKLSRSDVAGEYVDHDVRGRTVLTIDGDRIGVIGDLLLDMVDGRVCFLEVRSEGPLGIRGQRSLIPIEAMSDLDEHQVFVEHSSDHVSTSPLYNPHVTETVHYLNDVYEHYGYAPLWAPDVEIV